MKKIYWMVLRAYFGPLVLTFFIAVFILLMQFVWLYLDDLVGKGLEWTVIIELLFYASWTTVPMALPLSILLSSLMTFGNMGEHYELVATKSSGISLWKTMRPLIILSIIISCLAFLFSNNALPFVLYKQQSLLSDIKRKKLSFNIKGGEFYHDIDGYVLRVGRKGKDNKMLYDILIYDHTQKNGISKMTVAEKGEMAMSKDENTIILTLENGCNYDETVNEKSKLTYPMQRIYYESQIMHFDISGFAMNRSSDDMFKTKYTMLNLNQLNAAVDSLSLRYQMRQQEFINSNERAFTVLKPFAENPDTLIQTNIAFDTIARTPMEGLSLNEQRKVVAEALELTRAQKQSTEFYKTDLNAQETVIRKHKIVRHEKFTLSFACLVLFFIGAPLGAIIRKGGLGLPVVMATFIFILFHVLNITGRKYAVIGTLPIWEGMWLSSLILFPFGLFLSLKATNDSPLFDLGTWKSFFIQIFTKKKKNEHTAAV